MRKQVFGKRFKRDKNERKALFKTLMSSLIMYEKIQTTEAKAKAIKSTVEKIVTKVVKKGEEAARLLHGDLTKQAIDKLVSDLAPRFVNRPGGYTRIIRLGRRTSDSASMVIMEWVEEKSNTKGENIKGKKTKESKVALEATVKSGQKEKKTAVKETKKVVKKASAKKAKQKEEEVV